MKPILFNTEMVRAILDGRKTVTRRVIKPQPVCYGPNKAFDAHDGDFFLSAEKKHLRCRLCGHDPEYSREGSDVIHHWKPPYMPGDILYVRETWAPYCINKKYCHNYLLGHADYCFKASPDSGYYGCVEELGCGWHPSIHMPKLAARIFLRVKSVRVERLKSISVSDAMDEGVSDWNEFVSLWDSTVKPADRSTYGWNANPWVWVIEFEKCEKPEEVPGC